MLYWSCTGCAVSWQTPVVALGFINGERVSANNALQTPTEFGGSHFHPLTTLIFVSTNAESKINVGVRMESVRIYQAPMDVGERLRQFGVTREEIIEVVEQVVAARLSVVKVDAKAAAGQQAYLAGVRHMRFLWLPKGWEMDTTAGIESVIHPESRIRIVYQSVDSACVAIRAPQAINAKGKISRDLVKAGQGHLFEATEVPELAPRNQKQLNATVWYLCVSASHDGDGEDDVRAELSLPAAIKGGNFKGFHERIFVVKAGEWDSRHRPADRRDDDDGAYEFSIERR